MKPYTIVVMRKKELFIAILSAKSPHDARCVRRSMYRVLTVHTMNIHSDFNCQSLQKSV